MMISRETIDAVYFKRTKRLYFVRHDQAFLDGHNLLLEYQAASKRHANKGKPMTAQYDLARAKPVAVNKFKPATQEGPLAAAKQSSGLVNVPIKVVQVEGNPYKDNTVASPAVYDNYIRLQAKEHDAGPALFVADRKSVSRQNKDDYDKKFFLLALPGDQAGSVDCYTISTPDVHVNKTFGYYASLAVQLPFTVAFDIITFPLQAIDCTFEKIFN